MSKDFTRGPPDENALRHLGGAARSSPSSSSRHRSNSGGEGGGAKRFPAGTGSAEAVRKQNDGSKKTSPPARQAASGGGSAPRAAQQARPYGGTGGGRHQGASSSSSSLTPKEAQDRRSKTQNIVQRVAALYGITEGGVKLTYEDSLLVTLPWRAEARDAHFMKIFAECVTDSHGTVNVLDAFGGVGFDFFALMGFMGKLVRQRQTRSACVCIAQPEDDTGRFDRLEHNIRAYVRFNEVPGLRTRVFADTIQSTLRNEIDRGTEFKVIYADPPWPAPPSEGGGGAHGSAVKPSYVTLAYIKHLKETLFDPLAEIRAPRAAFICLKAPTPFVEFSIALFKSSPYLRGYELDADIPMLYRAGNIVGYFHFLRFVGRH